MKKCGKCKTEKEVFEFYKDKHSPDGVTGSCKECCKTAVNLAHRKNPQRKKYAGMKRLYGLEGPEFEKMLQEQDHNCNICGIKMVRPYIDHDHKTGKVRALLCHHCNSLIGLAKEDETILLSAIDYLKKYSQEKALVS